MMRRHPSLDRLADQAVKEVQGAVAAVVHGPPPSSGQSDSSPPRPKVAAPRSHGAQNRRPRNPPRPRTSFRMSSSTTAPTTATPKLGQFLSLIHISEPTR